MSARYGLDLKVLGITKVFNLMSLSQLLDKFKNSNLAKNTFWMILGQGARIPIQAVYFILIARALGSQGYGAFVGITALVGIMAPFVSLGSGNILIKNVSRNESSFQKYWGKSLVLTLLSGIILLIVTAILSKLLLPNSIPISLVFSISLADLIFSRLFDVTTQAYQAFQKLERTSQLVILPNALRLLLLTSLLFFTQKPSPTLWGYFYLASIVISTVIGILLVNKELGRPVIDRGIIFAEIREGIYFSVSVSSLNIYNDIDKVMLTRLATLEAAGIYGAAYRFIDVAFTPVRSLLCAAYAQFFKSGISGICGTLAFALKLLPYAVGYCIVISIVLFLLAPIFPYVLGSDFNDTVLALRWLSLLPLIKSIHSFAADSLTGAGFQGARTICQVLTAILNITLILWLIPTYSWKGAAWASLASDLFLALVLWALVFRCRSRESIHTFDHHHVI